MQCVIHAAHTALQPTSPLVGCIASRSGIRGRDRSRTFVQLLDRAGPLVDDAMKQTHRTSVLDLPTAASQIRHPAVHPSLFPSPPLGAEGTFNAVFDSSGEALVIIDPSGMIQRANLRARELLRLKHVTNTGAALADFLAGTPAEKLASFWADPVSSARAKSLDASLSTGFPVRLVLRSILPGTHNLLLCMEEGSIVQRADAKWRQLDAELRSVLDSVQVGVVLVDPSGQIRFSNARFGQLFGLVARQLPEFANF